MRVRVGKYRRQPMATGEEPQIGCVFVRDTVFVPRDALADSVLFENSVSATRPAHTR
jgi:hypothetical protein